MPDTEYRTISDRFDKIEEKLETLSEAMIALARAEEKLVNIERNYISQYERMNRFSEKIDKIEEKLTDLSNSVNFMSKFFWVACTVGLGALITQYLSWYK